MPGTTPVLDSFDRADGDLGANWGALNFGVGGLTIVSNEAAAVENFGTGYWTTPFDPNQEAFVTIPTDPDSTILLLARVSNPDNEDLTTGYCAYWNSGTIGVYRLDPGFNFTLLASASRAFHTYDTLSIEVIDSTVTAFVRSFGGSWEQVVTATDATYPYGGYIGIQVSTTNIRLDDFGGGSIASETPAPPASAPGVRLQGAIRADVPHLALPFRFWRGRPVVVEQDSVDDVAACVEAVLRTRPGQRDELPAFGTPELTFRQAPLPTDALVSQVETWEPRARVLVDEDPDRFDDTVRRVRVTVSTEE